MRYVFNRGESTAIKTVSDYITPKKINTWGTGDTILIFSPTGSGKSHFVKHTLRDYCAENKLRCLYLLSRIRTKEQFEKDLSDDDAITFATYQSLEAIESTQAVDYGEWDVVVADECHYFFADSSFNHRTDLSLDWILNQRKAIRVFMTATYNGILEDFERRGIPYIGYILESDNPKISSLQFFWSETQLDRLADQIISRGDKGIFFIQSAKKAYDLYAKYKNNGLFLCSKHNEKFGKYLDTALIDQMLANERFGCSLLITTQALDTGVTLKDRSLTTIVTDMTDPSIILQCAGRKRLVDEDDRLDLYVRARSNQQIAGVLKKQREYVDTIQDFLKNGSVNYNAKNERSNDSARLIFDDPEVEGEGTVFHKRINQLKYAQIQQNIKMYEDMLKLGECCYIKYVARLFGCEKYSILEDDQMLKNLTKYLDGVAGEPMLTKADREPLIERLNIRHNGRLCKTSKVLAAWLESSGLPYRLHEYRTHRKADDGERKSCRAWMIVKLA